jgi:hypothetical protein
MLSFIDLVSAWPACSVEEKENGREGLFCFQYRDYGVCLGMGDWTWEDVVVWDRIVVGWRWRRVLDAFEGGYLDSYDILTYYCNDLWLYWFPGTSTSLWWFESWRYYLSRGLVILEVDTISVVNGHMSPFELVQYVSWLLVAIPGFLFQDFAGFILVSTSGDVVATKWSCLK